MTSSSSLMQMRGNHDIKFLLLTQHKYLHTMLKDLGDVLKNDPHVNRMWPERGKNETSKIPRVVLPKCSKGMVSNCLDRQTVRQLATVSFFILFEVKWPWSVFFAPSSTGIEDDGTCRNYHFRRRPELPRRFSSRLRCGIQKAFLIMICCLIHVFSSCSSCMEIIGIIIDIHHFFIMFLFCHLHLHHSPGSESSPFGLIHEVRGIHWHCLPMMQRFSMGANGKERIGPHIFWNGKHVPLWVKAVCVWSIPKITWGWISD